MQKIYFLVALLSLSISGFSQELTTAEIARLKIKNIAYQSAENTSPGGKMEWVYNEKGDEIAFYNYGKRLYYNDISYNDKGKKAIVKQFSDDGQLTKTSTYTYKADGSYTVETIDKKYSLKDVEWFDATGLLTSRTIPDGSVHRFVYNSKKQLEKSFAEPKNGGIEFTSLYTYDNAGKLIKKVTTGEYPGTVEYKYNKDGLLVQTINTSEDGESSEKTIFNYSYGY